MLDLRITARNDWPWFAQPKPKLPKYPLALSDTKINTKALIDIGTQRFAIPNAWGKPNVLGRQPKHCVNLLNLRFTESSRSSTPLFVHQPLKTPLSICIDPIPDRSLRIAKQFANARARQFLCSQKNRVESVVITRIIISPDFVLQNKCGSRVVNSYGHA
jgi:hypothetical protein